MDPSIFEDPSNPYWNPEALYGRRGPSSTPTEKGNVFSRLLKLGKSSKSSNNNNNDDRYSRPRPMSYHDVEDFRLSTATKSPVERMLAQKSSKKDVSRSHSWIYGSVKLPSDVPFYDYSPERPSNINSNPSQSATPSKSMDYSPAYGTEYDFLPPHPAQYKGVDPSNWRQYALNESRKHSRVPEKGPEDTTNLTKKLASSVRKLTWKSLKHAVKRRPTLDALKRWPPDQPEGAGTSTEPIYASNYFFPEKKAAAAIYASCTNLYGESPQHVTASVRVRPKRTRQSWPDFGPMPNYQSAAPAGAIAANDGDDEEIYHSEWDLRQFMPYDVWLQATDPMMNPPPPTRMPKAKVVIPPAQVQKPSSSSAIYGEAIYKQRSNSILQPDVTAYQLLNKSEESPSDSDNLSDNAISEERVRIGGQGIYMVPSVQAPSNQPVVMSNPPKIKPPALANNLVLMDAETWTETVKRPSRLESSTPDSKIYGSTTLKTYFSQPISVEPSGKVEPPQDFKNDQRTDEIYGENGTSKSTRFAENSDKFGDNFSTKSVKFSDVKSLKVEGSPEKSVQFSENSPKKSTQFAENSPKKSIKFAENPDKFNEKDKIKCRESSESSSPSGGGGGGRYIKRRKSRSTNQKSRLMKEVIYEESDDDNDGRESNQVYAVKIIVSQNNTSEYVKPILKKERVYYNEAAGIVVNEQQQQQQTTHNTAAESSGEMCEFSLQQQQQQNSTRKKVQFESNHVIVCADELSDETEVETGPPDTSDWIEDEQRLSSSASSSDNYDTQEPQSVGKLQSLKYENSQQNESKETERQQLYYHLQQQEEQEQQRKSQQCELQSHRQPQQHHHQHIHQSHEDEEAEDEVRVEPSRTNDHHQHHHHEPARIEQKLSAAAPFKANPMDKPAQRNTVKVGPASPPCYPTQFAALNPNSLLFNDTTRLRLNQNRRPSIEQTFKLNISPIETIVVPAHKPRIKHSNSFRQAGSPSLSVLRPREPPPPPPVVSSTVSPKAPLVSTTASSVPPPPPLPSSTSIQQTLSRISAISPSKGSQQVKQNGSQQANSKVIQHGKPNISREVNSKVSQQGKSKGPQQILYSSSSQALAEKCKAVEKVLSQSYHNQQQQRQSNVTLVTDEVAPCSEIIAPVKTQEQVYGDSKNIEILTRENAVSEIRIYSTTESLKIDRTSGPAQVLATYGTGMSNNKIEEVHYAATEIINPPETVHRRQHSAPPALRPHSSVILIVDNEAIYGDVDHAQYGATAQNSSSFINSLESQQQVGKIQPPQTVSRNATPTDNLNAKTFPHNQLRAAPRSGNASSGETEYASRQQQQQPAHAQDLEYIQRPVSSIYAQQPKIYEATAQVQSPQEPSAHELEDELDEPLYDDVMGRKLKKEGASTRLLKESKEVIEAGRMVLKYLQNYGTKTYGPTPVAPPLPPPLPSLPPSSEIYSINNNTDNLYNDIEVQVDRNNCYNDSMTYDSRLRDEGIIYDDTLSLLSSTYGRSDRTIMNEDDEEPIYDDVLNLRTGDSDSGAETEDCPPPLPAQGPPKITSEIPTINFPLLNNNNNRNSVGPAGEQGKRHSSSFSQTLQSELEKRLATLGRSSEYSAYNASAQVASSSESSGVEEDYNPEKNLKADGVDENYRLNAVSKLVTDTISMARGKFLDSMKAANANKDVGFGAGKAGDDDDEEPIYEEIGGDAHRNTSPLYSDAFDAKSIFKGASKNEILSFLESIRDQLSAASVADSNQSDSRSSSLSRDETFNRRVIVGIMERNDSGIGSESGSLTAPTPHPTSPLCKDCNGLPTTENPDDTPNLCQTCTRKRSERKEILQEILKTELNYGRDLKIIRDEFYHPIKITGLCTPEQLEQIFLNVDQLIEINVGLTSELKKTMDEAEAVRDEDLSSVNVGKIFMDCADAMMNAFETYCRHQANAGALLTQLEKEKELLRIFLRVSQMENAVLRRMNLPAFLMVPVQRVTRYPLLLARLLKVTPSEHVSRSELSSAQLKIEQHLELMNKSTREAASVRLWRKISIRNGSSSPVHRRASSDLDGAGAKKWPWF